MQKILSRILSIILIVMLLTNTIYAYEAIQPVVEEVTIIDNSEGEKIAQEAITYLGYKYAYGGNGPYYFDCSGFVQYIMKQCKYKVGRTVLAQKEDGEKISKKNLLPGDIVLFKNTYTSGYSHSGIYIGDNKFIHAANSRQGVIISSLNENYYKTRFACGVRIWVQNEILITPIFLE